jgi:hypothetical protein
MKTKIAFAVSLGMLVASASAFALPPLVSGYFAIRNLDATVSGVRVYQPGSAGTNPKGCSNVLYYEPAINFSVEQREAFDKVLVSAFLAGRKVALGIDKEACGATGAPAYTLVRVDAEK